MRTIDFPDACTGWAIEERFCGDPLPAVHTYCKGPLSDESAEAIAVVLKAAYDRLGPSSPPLTPESERCSQEKGR